MNDSDKDYRGVAESRSRHGYAVTIWGALLNLLLSAVKLTAGLFGHSRALVADAVHSLSDLGSDLVVLGGLRLAQRPEDRTHRYGHGKYETLAALILGIMLAFAGLAIGWSAVRSGMAMWRGEIPNPPGGIALVAAATSILVKEGLFRWTRNVARRIDSAVVMANALHHRSDAFSSVATLVGVAGAMLLGRPARILDPVAALVVAAMILYASLQVLRQSGNELLDAAVEPEVEKRILEVVRGVAGAHNPHQLRTRRVGCRMVVDLHLNVDPRISLLAAHDISHTAEERLLAAFGADTIVTIHIEPGVAYPAGSG